MATLGQGLANLGGVMQVAKVCVVHRLPTLGRAVPVEVKTAINTLW